MCARTYFRANKVWKVYQKFLFWKRRSWYKNGNCQFVTLINMECLRVFSHFYAASSSVKMCFYETSNVFLSQILNAFSKKLLSASESSIKIMVRAHWGLFVILLTSAIICKQRLLHGKKIIKYFQNCKCYNNGQDHFRKLL